MTPEQIAAALAAPFPAASIGWKAQAVKGNRCLAVAYLDARDVMDRLDDALGVNNWQDSYCVQDAGTVSCTLSVRVNGEWISKTDAGCESDQKDEGDRRKAAYSDALKRAAVRWGVGRYLYRLDNIWADYDPQKQQIVGTPKLPLWALPRPADVPLDALGREKVPPPKRNGAPSPPADGAELVRRLLLREAALVAKGLCKPHELTEFVRDAGARAGLGVHLHGWQCPEPGYAVAIDAVKEFERLRAPAAEEALERLDALCIAKGKGTQDLRRALRLPSDHAALLTAEQAQKGAAWLLTLTDAVPQEV